ncbi:MAG: hydroxyethylthiazole kinase [Agathobacter rectalis]
MNNYIEKLKSRSPLIHNITNMVTINDVANIELACGARPIMAMAPQEMDEVTGICDGLNLNIGTPLRSALRRCVLLRGWQRKRTFLLCLIWLVWA